MRFTQLNDWLAWQESLHTQEIDLGLDRVREVATKMGLLEPKAQVVTIAGTNGKGSCVATLEALLSSADASVISYTSPHMLVYNERIRSNGMPVEDELICRAFERIDQARQSTSLTYFEFGTLAAIEIASSLDVDYLVLEVGLGGRLDAVNIIDADVAIVTSVAIDHEAWLGSDIEVIGREKAGVFRSGKPAICATPDLPGSVRACADEVGAIYYSVGQVYRWSQDAGNWSWSGTDSHGHYVELTDLPAPNLPMPSVAAAVQAYLLLGCDFEARQRQALADISLPGRCQRITVDGVELTLDVAHNPAASAYLAEKIRGDNSSSKLTVIAAIMEDKDIESVLAPLLSLADEWLVADLKGNNRAATAEMIISILSRAYASAQNHPLLSQADSVSSAVNTALQKSVAGDRVLIMGSFFTVSEALLHLNDITGNN